VYASYSYEQFRLTLFEAFSFYLIENKGKRKALMLRDNLGIADHQLRALKEQSADTCNLILITSSFYGLPFLNHAMNSFELDVLKLS
jgi:hypothetical protein